MRRVAGVRVWPVVALVRVTPVAAAALPSALLTWILWDLSPVLAVVAGIVAGAAGGWVVVRHFPATWPGGEFAGRYRLGSGPPDWAQHARIANRVARRSPAEGERLLRLALAEGSPDAYPALIALLRRQGRADEAGPVRDGLVSTGGERQLAGLVAMHEGDARTAALFQEALVERFPGAASRREHLVALLAEAGRHDEAMAAHRAARRDGEPATFVVHHVRAARALAGGGRSGAAEEVLRDVSGHPQAAAELALLLADQGREAEAEELLRGHPETDDPAVRYALATLLRGSGRAAEAEALRPRAGWPHERARRARRAAGGSPDPGGYALPDSGRRPDPFIAVWGDAAAGGHHAAGEHSGGGHSGGGDYGGGGRHSAGGD
jgi:uncharacterized membrane protein YgcG